MEPTGNSKQTFIIEQVRPMKWIANIVKVRNFAKLLLKMTTGNGYFVYETFEHLQIFTTWGEIEICSMITSYGNYFSNKNLTCFTKIEWISYLSSYLIESFKSLKVSHVSTFVSWFNGFSFTTFLKWVMLILVCICIKNV